MSRNRGNNPNKKRQKRQQLTGRYTEVYYSARIPERVPPFVNPHLTCLDEGGYLFEIDPTHMLVEVTRSMGQTVETLLESCGFEGVSHIYSGIRPAGLDEAC